MTDETKPDSFELLPDGKVRLTIVGRQFTLRRPTFGQSRKLRESVVEWSAEERRDLQDQADKAKREVPVDEEEAAERAFARQERILRWWLEEVIPTLSSESVEGVGIGELPEWLLNRDGVTNPLLEHWRSVPAVPGGR